MMNKIFEAIATIIQAMNPVCPPTPTLYTRKELEKREKNLIRLKFKHVKLLEKRLRHKIAGKDTEKDDDKIREIVFKIQADEAFLNGVKDILVGT